MAKRSKPEIGKITEPKGLTRTVEFQVDTIPEQTDAIVTYHPAAYYSSDSNSITANYVNDKYNKDVHNECNEYSQSAEVLTHETKHKDNQTQGMYAYALSPELAYKTNMHDEISANITELVTLREKYIKTGDIKVFDAVPNFKFYADAIKSGRINPKSMAKFDFDQDMSLIINGTKDMWMKQFAETYLAQNSNNGAYYGEKDDKHAKFYKQNYERAKKIAYGNIGGVDFTKYMKGDVEIPQEAYNYMLKNNFEYYQKAYNFSEAQILKTLKMLAYDGSISLEEYKCLLQHQMALNNRYGSISSIDEKGNIVTKYNTPQEYLKKHNSEMVAYCKKTYTEITGPKCTNADENKKEYPTFEAFLNANRQCEAKSFQADFNSATYNEALIDKLVEYQAREYAKTGKKIRLDDNEEVYQKKLETMYGGTYNWLKPDEDNIKWILSDKANDIIIDSRKSWFDKRCDELKAFKHSCTHITDENGNEKEVGVLEKAKYKATQIAESVVNFFSGDRTDEVTNDPINQVNTQAPEYREWKDEDGSRVSPVQKKEILNMNEEIIAKPKDNNKKDPTVEQPSSLNIKKPDLKYTLQNETKKLKTNLEKVTDKSKKKSTPKTKSGANKNKKTTNITQNRNRGNSR